jgi:hypothetical protein
VLRARDREITVEVNSVQRLTRLVDILRKIGLDPVITAEKRIDPAMDFAWAAGQRASQGGTAAAAGGWESSGSMSTFLRCSAEHPGRPHAAGTGPT